MQRLVANMSRLGLGLGLGLGLALVAACGGTLDLPAGIDAPAGDGDGGLDASDDATTGDPDGGLDAPPPAPFAGELTILETEVLLASAPAPYGQGLEARVVFTDDALLAAPVLEEQAGPLGCKVWERTPAQAAYAATGDDEGAVFFTFAGGSSPAIPPAMPSCRFVAGAGYRCVDLATSSSGGNITAGTTADTAVLTDADVPYSAASSLGRWLQIDGAAVPANDGLFPILAVQGAGSLVYANPARQPELLPGGAIHVNVAGVGPIPGVGDPGFLADDVALTINHVGGGAGHIPAFTLMTEAPAHVADDFTLDATSRALLTHLPRTGGEVTFTCATGCSESADAMLVRIVTTDAPVAGLSPVAMPAPVGKQVEIRCASRGTDTLTVPAAYMAKVMTSGATRVETRVVRGAVLTFAPPPVTALAGHALAGITTF